MVISRILFVSLLLISSTSLYAENSGKLERANCVRVSGWAWDNTEPDNPIQVTIKDGNTAIRTIKAGKCRQDLKDAKIGNGCHGFTYDLPFSFRQGGYSHILRATYANTDIDIPGSRKNIGRCASLNDTGYQTCSDATQGELTCPVIGFEGQDAEYGRDSRINLPKIGGARAGFDFTKIANDGSELDALAKIGPNPKDWACTLDNYTGLMWEIKSKEGGLRDSSNTYSWYYPDAANNGGAPGVQNGGTCAGGISCDTDAYAVAVNAAQLCGKTGWRLPTLAELRGIVDYSQVGPSLERTYFANTPATSFSWTSSPMASNKELAHVISHNYGNDSTLGKNTAQFVRLVRNHN